VEVGYFFDGLERTSPTAPTPKQRQMLELTRHFIGLSRRQQQVLCELARVLAGAPEGDGPEPDESDQAA